MSTRLQRFKKRVGFCEKGIFKKIVKCLAYLWTGTQLEMFLRLCKLVAKSLIWTAPMVGKKCKFIFIISFAYLTFFKSYFW